MNVCLAISCGGGSVLLKNSASVQWLKILMASQLLERGNTTKFLPMTEANLIVEKMGSFSLHSREEMPSTMFIAGITIAKKLGRVSEGGGYEVYEVPGLATLLFPEVMQ